MHTHDPADTPTSPTDTPTSPVTRRERTPEQGIFERLYEGGPAPAGEAGSSSHLPPEWYEAE